MLDKFTARVEKASTYMYTYVHVCTYQPPLSPSIVAMTGRVERMFQVLPDQEEAMFIGDMFSDGLFVVELPSQSLMGTTDPNPTILLSPEMEEARLAYCVCVCVRVCVCVCVCVCV